MTIFLNWVSTIQMIFPLLMLNLEFCISPQIFPPSWHLLHLHLDIHWSVLEILHLLGHKMQGICLVLAPQYSGRKLRLKILKYQMGFVCITVSWKQAFCNFYLFFSPGQVVYAHQFVNLTGENMTDTSLFEEHLCSLLCDLTGLAIGKYSKVCRYSLHVTVELLQWCFCVMF